MGFVGVYRALYDYAPQAEGELQLSEGDLLYVLEKSTEDDWWKAKRKATSEDEDEAEGLVPNNYLEQVSGMESGGPVHRTILESQRPVLYRMRLTACA